LNFAFQALEFLQKREL